MPLVLIRLLYRFLILYTHFMLVNSSRSFLVFALIFSNVSAESLSAFSDYSKHFSSESPFKHYIPMNFMAHAL